ncbi:CLUMA_CG013401, isoform A [Clunio marinus]|uniref:CLUMA_CG013401, isoform A n=1 Tax=Clunio marinus TaxID=568069 RepID=A0A1J1INR1_9DIPT|nr:CLUMA_CG013401, isoform A [Clunio marinus]
MADVAPAATADAPPAPAPAAPEAPKPNGPAYWKFPPKPKRKGSLEGIDEDTKLSRDQLKTLKEAFRIFDSDNTGCIQLDVVKEILTLFNGHEVDDDELNEVMEEFDEDENGTIEFPEFIKLAEEFVEPEEDYNTAKKDLREIFMMYDREQKGYIPVADFKAILKELDNDLSDDEAEQMVKELDSDCSGTIEFEEFIDAMLGDDDDRRY